MKKAVMFYGKPGSGKGTQANLLAWRRGFFHFDTGKELEILLHDPDKQNDPVIQRERAIFDSGKLNTPEWVLEFVIRRTREIANAGLNLVFSGSPRTMLEAFGSDGQNGGLLQILEQFYSKEGLCFVLLDISSDSSVFRNVNREICSICKTPLMAGHKNEACPICGANLYKRVLDNPEIMKKRLEEYETRTSPILDELQKRGYPLHKIDAEPKPYIVHQAVLNILGL